MNLNLGAGPNWKNEGWHILDHKISKNEGYKIKGNLNDINLKDQSCDLIFISHTLEHIPHIQIQNVLTEINRIMKFGSTIRILVPNLYWCRLKFLSANGIVMIICDREYEFQDYIEKYSEFKKIEAGK